MAYIEIGSTPCDEECAQTGHTPDYERLQRAEGRAYIVALRRKYGEEPEGAQLRVKRYPHDFGGYHEVVCTYDHENAEASSYAQTVENGLATWDEVGMWAPVKYDNGKVIHEIADPDLWIKEANPQCRTSKEDINA